MPPSYPALVRISAPYSGASATSLNLPGVLDTEKLRIVANINLEGKPKVYCTPYKDFNFAQEINFLELIFSVCVCARVRMCAHPRVLKAANENCGAGFDFFLRVKSDQLWNSIGTVHLNQNGEVLSPETCSTKCS